MYPCNLPYVFEKLGESLWGGFERQVADPDRVLAFGGSSGRSSGRTIGEFPFFRGLAEFLLFFAALLATLLSMRENGDLRAFLCVRVV
jgi:hypothetical protein